ncbi:MAG: hypothetical protein HC878_00170 [Leptolyngbyaceae cyanobacterium SL_5_14]|nr:hypothetical protein [Leptolyngbyaceae cyanobacterium SL_5_14]
MTFTPLTSPIDRKRLASRRVSNIVFLFTAKTNIKGEPYKPEWLVDRLEELYPEFPELPNDSAFLMLDAGGYTRETAMFMIAKMKQKLG